MANAGGSPAPTCGTSTPPSIRCLLSFYRSNFVVLTSGCESPNAQVAYGERIKRTDAHGLLCGERWLDKASNAARRFATLVSHRLLQRSLASASGHSPVPIT